MKNETYPLEPLFGKILSPFESFLRRTTAGGLVLIVTTGITLGIATLVGDEAFHHLWARTLAIAAPPQFVLELSWHQWVNDALMALFFLLVGLELKREILVGELSSLKDAALPVVAATGGMVVPALVYSAINGGTATASGWGIPMATDIAFAVGILVLLAWRVPKNLIVFLTALAIADDLGAVLVIAIFYTHEIGVGALQAVGGLFLLLLLFNRGGVRHPLPYAIAGVALWYAMFSSGVHATLAGILLAATIPARPAHSAASFERRIDELQGAFSSHLHDSRTTDDPLSNYGLASLAEAIEGSAVAVQSPLQRIEHALTPWVTFVVIPVFALANAGIDLSGVAWSDALSSRVTLGVVAGLVFGKFLGITLFSYAAVRLGLGRLPSGVQWKHLMGAAWLGGIGFTMSLFIGQLAFRSDALVEQAKLGILLGSALSAALGLAWLFAASRGERAGKVPAQMPQREARDR
jgi:NhaA family Na+:H+ antiporter